MEREERSKDDPLSVYADRLVASARRHDFYAVISVLERLTSSAPRVGDLGPVRREAIRFRHDPSLGFSAGELRKVERVRVPQAAADALEGPQWRFDVLSTFFGLTGTVSPLPFYLIEEVLHDDVDHGIRRDFLDIFHHRLISLMYRIGIKFDQPREYLPDWKDVWSKRVLSFGGIDGWSGSKSKLESWEILRLIPALAMPNRSARIIELAIADVFAESLQHAQVSVQQFCGTWTTLDGSQQMVLGVTNHVLGKQAVLGTRCIDRAGLARIVIEPLAQHQFRRFLPDGDCHPKLSELLGLLVNEPIEFELDLVLANVEQRAFRLGAPDAKLGKEAWLASGAARSDKSHLVVPLARKAAARLSSMTT